MIRFNCSFVLPAGPRPRRYFKISDLWTHPKHDINHPYSVNYLGIKRILAAMYMNKIPKLIRITGALTDRNPFSPFVMLFNLLGAFRIKWNHLSEIDIRKSGIDYTGQWSFLLSFNSSSRLLLILSFINQVIRPFDIINDTDYRARTDTDPAHGSVFIRSADSGVSADELLTIASLPEASTKDVDSNTGSEGTRKAPRTIKRLQPNNAITLEDLTSLIVVAVRDKRLVRSTVLCATKPSGGVKDWGEAIAASQVANRFLSFLTLRCCDCI